MSRALRSQTTIQHLEIGNNRLILAIVSKNAIDVRNMINVNNVNDIIDTSNKFRAIHYALSIKDNVRIIEYLLSCGANVYEKYDDVHDALDLLVDNNYRFLFDHIIKQKDLKTNEICKKLNNKNHEIKKLKHEYDELKQVNDTCINTISVIRQNNQALTNDNKNLLSLNMKLLDNIDVLRFDNNQLKIDRDTHKRKYYESTTAFNNLLKQQRK